MIVDDDDELRDVINVAVAIGGYKTTLFAKNPKSALSLIQGNADLVFLLTDLHMYGAEIDGIELARQAKIINPQIHTILLSEEEITQVQRMRFPGAVDRFLDKFELASRLIPEMESLRGQKEESAAILHP